MQTIIVDDDPMSIEYLKRLCEKSGHINLIQSFTNSIEALKYLKENYVDLLLLDIEMPNLTGIDILNKVSFLPKVIFTTSKTDYAFDAFQYDAVDYLKKPFSFPRFQKAIDKVMEQELTIEKSFKSDENLYIKEKGKYIRLAMEDILYFENVRDYVCVKTHNQTYTIISTLKEIAGKLPDHTFLKVHRSYIVNLNKIVDIDNTSLVVSNKVIPISRVNRPILMKRIQSL